MQRFSFCHCFFTCSGYISGRLEQEGRRKLKSSNNQALVLYGKLAIAGELGCILGAVILLPALVLKLKI